MKISILILLLSIVTSSNAQERIFSIGYTYNLINSDSTNFNLNLDFNRNPSSSEKTGGYYFVSDKFTPNLDYYVRPTIDMNIGTGTSITPNNISLAIPCGLNYNPDNLLISVYFEGTPELVSEKTLTNYLAYLSNSVYLKYEFGNAQNIFQVQPGISISNGVREYSSNELTSNFYGRLTTPLYFGFIHVDSTDVKIKSDQIEEKKERIGYRKIVWATSFKYSHIYSDNPTITLEDNYIYINSKFDYFLIPRLAIGVVYNYGNEEPLFKNVHSLSLNLTLARFY